MSVNEWEKQKPKSHTRLAPFVCGAFSTISIVRTKYERYFASHHKNWFYTHVTHIVVVVSVYEK